MVTVFDPVSGVLRVRHPALAVLARLATDPTDTRLHDHDVAPLVAELRAAGLIGTRGIPADVAPIAATVGSAHTSGEIVARDHGSVHRTRLWVGERLVVAGVEVADKPHSYDLMADRADAVGSLVAELVGLAVAPDPAVEGARTMAADAFASLLAAESRVSAAEVADALDALESDDWAAALTVGLRGSALRWRLSAVRDGEPLLDIEVLDAGRSGLWLADYDGDVVTVRAVSPADVGSRLDRLGRPRSRRPEEADQEHAP